MKEIDKIAKRIYDNKEKMELRDFLILTELERVELLIVLKGFEENKDLKREEFLNKYFNFNNNMRRYIKNVGAWDGINKQWYKYIDRVMEYKELYPELNQNKEVVDIKTICDKTNPGDIEKLIGAYIKEVVDKKVEDNNLRLNYKKMRELESFKNKEDLTKLISAKLPEEAIEILNDFKKEYGFKKQEIITLALLDFQNKYGKSL